MEFALLANAWGLVQSFVTFCLGLNAIVGNIDPSVLICKPKVEPGSVFYDFINSFCELGYGTLYLGVFNTTIPTTLIAVTYMILNGLLCYGLIEKKRKFICIWQFGNYLLTIALLFITVYVSYLLISELIPVRVFNEQFQPLNLPEKFTGTLPFKMFGMGQKMLSHLA